MSVCIQAGSTCHHFSSHSSNSKTCWAIEFHFIYKLYSQNRNHFYIFFNLLKPKIYRTWQIYMLVGKSVGHHGCGNFWGCLGISLLYYCTIIIPLYQAMWLYKDVQYTIENIYILQVRFNRMIHNLTCILSEPPRQIL